MSELVAVSEQVRGLAEVIEISERALEEIRAVLHKEAPGPEMGLRIGVAGGGCSGLSYQMEFSEQRLDDTVQLFGDVRVLMDPQSAVHLKGVRLDFSDGLLERGFQFHNPKATRTCKCGDSFAV